LAKDDASYKRLRSAGLDAVPVLIAHLDDFRLTRSIQTDSDGRHTWHMRIADVVAGLLDELANEPFSYDVLRAEGRGKRLDRNHVLYWWSGVQKKDVRPRIP
jgi:hypothetical protein